MSSTPIAFKAGSAVYVVGVFSAAQDSACAHALPVLLPLFPVACFSLLCSFSAFSSVTLQRASTKSWFEMAVDRADLCLVFISLL